MLAPFFLAAALRATAAAERNTAVAVARSVAEQRFGCASTAVSAEVMATNAHAITVRVTQLDTHGLIRHLDVTSECCGRAAKPDVSTPEFALARQIRSASEEQARGLLLANEPLLTRDLCRALIREAIDAGNDSHHDVQSRLDELAFLVGAYAGDRGGLAMARSLQAITERRHDLHRAEEISRQAVAEAEASGDPDAIVRASIDLGLTLWDMVPVSDEAVELFRKAIALESEVENRVMIVRAHNDLAMVLELIDPRTARLEYAKAIELARKVGDRRGVAAASLDVAEMEMWQDDDVAARDTARRIERDYRAIGERLGEGQAILVQAMTEAKLHHYQRAAALADRALRIGRAIGEAPFAASSMTTSAEIHIEQKKYGLARRELEESQCIQTALGMETWDITLDLGRIAFALGAYDDALLYAREAIRSTAVGLYEELVQAQILAAKAARALGRNREAEVALRAAVERMEVLRADFIGARQQLPYAFDKERECYPELADLLLSEGRTFEALQISEQGKARALRDLLRQRTRAELLTAGQRESRARQEQLIAALNRQIEEADDAQSNRVVALRERLDEARAALDEFESLLSSGERQLTVPAPLPEELRAAVARLPRGAAFIELAVTEKRTHAFVISDDGDGQLAVTVQTIDVSAAELKRRVDRLVSLMASRSLSYRDPLDRLSRLIVAPLAGALRQHRIICIVPDGPLWNLPFGALRNDGRYLVETNVLFIAPSVAAYAAMTRQHPHRAPSQHELLAVGNPALRPGLEHSEPSVYRGVDLGPLPDAEHEVAQIARLYGRSSSRVLLRERAREAAVVRDIGRFRILHFATHAVVDAANPMYSHLLLARGDPDNPADDGRLDAGEIMRLHLDADIAVLSACDTARGTALPGEGTIGLAWAFLVAGCPTTVVSQWHVVSSATDPLMIAFHRALLAGQSAPEALQTAQLTLLRNERFAHPLYWAPFVVVGNGGVTIDH